MIFEWNLMKLSGTAVIKEILSNSSSALVVHVANPNPVGTVIQCTIVVPKTVKNVEAQLN